MDLGKINQLIRRVSLLGLIGAFSCCKSNHGHKHLQDKSNKTATSDNITDPVVGNSFIIKYKNPLDLKTDQLPADIKGYAIIRLQIDSLGKIADYKFIKLSISKGDALLIGQSSLQTKSGLIVKKLLEEW